MNDLVHSGASASIPLADGFAVLPLMPTDEMMMAARGLIMAHEMKVPTYGYSLGKVAESGFYSEHWAHILTEEERAISSPLTKAHMAQLIWRAMVSAALKQQKDAA